MGDLFNSMLSFANASTVFTIHQMQNALVAFMEPQGVMNRVKYSLDKISCAMKESVDDARHEDTVRRPPAVVSSDPVMEDDMLTGRKR